MNDTLTPALMRRLAESVGQTRYGIDLSGLTEKSELSLILSPLVRVVSRHTPIEYADLVAKRDMHIATAKNALNAGHWKAAAVSLHYANDNDNYRKSIKLVASDEGLIAVSMMKR